ncbi:hypothetical protein DLD82_16950 [Methanospirillum stamsii]|uniref:PKD domain-containing protein n=2 Tax=Methanospirillum stamsii TaxID=1277351 RepID=A0A2V2N0S2_9EURY|nr:hypothetical protein DLD82_16950 [Methanospirillum stamsii]
MRHILSLYFLDLLVHSEILPTESNLNTYKGLMQDFLVDYFRELNLLKLLLEQGLVFKLIKEEQQIPFEIHLKQMTTFLHTNFGTDLKAAKWAIEAWAEALGIHLVHTCIADFSINPAKGDAPLLVQFINKSKGEISRYEWDFGNGITSNEKNPVYQYNIPGTYSVTLRTYRGSFFSEKKMSDAVTILYPELNGVISNSIQTGEIPLSIQFFSKVQGIVQSFKWDFGDGIYSNEANPIHIYEKEGSYNVNLTLNDGNSTIQIDLPYPILVTPESLHADYSISQPDQGKKLQLQFLNRSKGNITRYHWDFGDGTQSDEENPFHEYVEKYLVTLTVTDEQTGEQEISTCEIIPTLAPCKAAFHHDIHEGIAPLEITFNNQSTGIIHSYDWDFGDGSTSTEKNPIHMYLRPGHYCVSLTVIDGLDHSKNVTTSEVRVKSTDFRTDFTCLFSSGCAPLKASFKPKYSNSSVKYHWLFGDGQESFEQNSSHEYKKSGTFSVTLRITQDGFTEEHVEKNLIKVKPSKKPLRALFSHDISE